jgi:hypothetical protein
VKVALAMSLCRRHFGPHTQPPSFRNSHSGTGTFPQNLTSINDDHFAITQISGFYGSESWASWLIALTTTWINISRGEATFGLDTCGHLLYTHRAAVSLFQQLGRHKVAFWPLFAAMVTTDWGLLHNLLQCIALACMWHSTKVTVKLAYIVGFGALVPAIALLALTAHTYGTLDSFRAGIFDSISITKDTQKATLSNVNTSMVFGTLLSILLFATQKPIIGTIFDALVRLHITSAMSLYPFCFRIS